MEFNKTIVRQARITVFTTKAVGMPVVVHRFYDPTGDEATCGAHPHTEEEEISPLSRNRT